MGNLGNIQVLTIIQLFGWVLPFISYRKSKKEEQRESQTVLSSQQQLQVRREQPSKLKKEVEKVEEAKDGSNLELQLEPSIEDKEGVVINEGQVSFQNFQSWLANAVDLNEQNQTLRAYVVLRALASWLEQNEDQVANRQQVRLNVHNLFALIQAKRQSVDYKISLEMVETIYEAEPIKYVQAHIVLLTNLGTVNFRHKNYQEAERFTEKALNLANKYFIDSDERKFYLINNLICLYFQTKETQKAQKMFNQAQKEMVLYNNKHFQSLKELMKSNYDHYADNNSKKKVVNKEANIHRRGAFEVVDFK